MKVFLSEITHIDSELEFTESEKWVADAVARLDEKVDGEVPRPKTAKVRPIRTRLNLRQVDEVVVINGDIETELQMLCSRCATPFMHRLHPDFSALFCKDPVMAGIAHLEKDPENHKAPGKPVGQNYGWARHAHDFSGGNGLDSGKDLDITYISHDFIDLADVLTEQLQLLVPFQPLCRETCKGMCSQCGADLNAGRCACAKIAKQSPFAALLNSNNKRDDRSDPKQGSGENNGRP